VWAEIRKTADIAPGVTGYALRHSSIVRQLLARTQVEIVARTHDTSEKEIRKHYAAWILDYADEMTRAALIDTAIGAAVDATS
jgi:hypothetical protein